jgi:hypothetical protein
MYLKYSILTFITILCLFQSCTNPFAPAKADEAASSSNLLTEQRSPDEVLTNFKFAYTFKDSLVYSELFDSSFVFLSMDYYESPPVPIQWGRDLELKTTARMFRFFNTLDLTFNVIQRDTSEYDQNNSPTKIQHEITFTLALDGGAVIPILDGDVTFAYVRRGPKWLISFWEDKKI